MSLEQHDEDNERTAEVLAELTGDPVEKFTYDGEIPDASEQEWEYVNEE
ncbi:MAG: hypothetical protein IH933_13380 [Euryarchaeota archaeon]|jgi:hypothetical protein|nr:hypothetical protein [Euryarchaeota archaeon]